MAIDVLLYHSGMSGAPGANLRVAGGLTDLLNACLVDGFNVRDITGIVRSGTTATATIDGSNPWQIGGVIELAGADQAAYNGRQRVTARTDSTVSFEVSGSPATPATGTITAKMPGAGWTLESDLSLSEQGAIVTYSRTGREAIFTFTAVDASTTNVILVINEK